LVANLATLVGLGLVWCEKPILGKTVGWGGGGGGTTAHQKQTPQKKKPKGEKKKKNQTKSNLSYLLPLICKRKDQPRTPKIKTQKKV